ncbi:hypothetical protein BDK92_7318 [Micromonospora pisi]|uniref:Uncharacterized protein n=1 Tax=Micromonospora pisi TaxID=589240 RepID=A0A495JUZ4_9ACTN|nr:hypothetical protein [Micromonospora pisi]RKR92836.1 hypothetical protein BDK92_7318 [Micromonospora pisi]
MTGRTWTLHIAAPAQLWSTNDSHNKGPRPTSANRKQWRKAGYDTAAFYRLPKHLRRVRYNITFHFTDRARRDALNYSETAKPVIDAFGPPFVQAPTAKRPNGASAPGWSLIPDDTPEYLESATLAIGPLWPTVLAGLPAADRRRLVSPHGGMTVVITDLSPADLFTPAAPAPSAALACDRIGQAFTDAAVFRIALEEIRDLDPATPAGRLATEVLAGKHHPNHNHMKEVAHV